MGISRAAPPHPKQAPRLRFKKPEEAPKPIRTLDALVESVGKNGRGASLADLQPKRK